MNRYYVVKSPSNGCFSIHAVTGEKVEGLFPNRQMAEKIAQRFTELELSTIHFYEVIEDLLCSYNKTLEVAGLQWLNQQQLSFL